MVVHNTILFPETIFLKSNDYSSLNNGTDKSDILFELKNRINIPNNINGYMQLNNFKFINSFYNINKYNNIFYYSINNNGVINDYQFSVNVGNYSINNLLTTLNNNLTGKITLTYDSLTFKINFVAVDNILFKLKSGEKNMLYVLGFDEQTEYVSSIKSVNLINLTGVQSLYICINNLNLMSNAGKNSRLNNVLECINIAVPTGNSQIYQNTTNTKYKIGDTNINQMQINIYDENNNLVNFNNTNWSLSINIIFAYNMSYIAPTSLNLEGVDNQIENQIVDEIK